MKVAKVISILGHPMFMPLMAVYLLLQFNPYINQNISLSLQKIVFGTIALFTIILPLLTAFILKQFNLISSIYMQSKEERIWPFSLTLLWYYFCFEILIKLNLPNTVYLMFIGAIAVISAALLITFYWKISIHMLGIGGLTGALIGISYRFDLNWILLICAMILISGFIGYARLKTNSHNFKQIYFGFILGFIIEVIVVLL